MECLQFLFHTFSFMCTWLPVLLPISGLRFMAVELRSQNLPRPCQGMLFKRDNRQVTWPSWWTICLSGGYCLRHPTLGLSCRGVLPGLSWTYVVTSRQLQRVLVNFTLCGAAISDAFDNYWLYRLINARGQCNLYGIMFTFWDPNLTKSHISIITLRISLRCTFYLLSDYWR